MLFKRIISALTGTAILVSCSSVLSGCSLKEFFSNENTSSNNGTLTNGEWLEMINDAFGMQVDENAEDGELDAAKAWDVIGEDEEIDKNAPVDDKFVTSTLMRAAGFADGNSTDEEIINAAIKHGVISDPNATLSDPQKAIESLTKTQDEWVSQEFEEHLNVELVEGVQNFSESMSASDFDVTDEGVIIPTKYAKNLSKDNIFILPKSKTTGEGGAYKVISTIENTDGTVRVKCVPAAPEEIYEKIDVSGKFHPSASNLEVSQDPRVSIVNDEPQGVSYNPDSISATPLGAMMCNQGSIQQLGSKGIESFNFKVKLDKDTELGIAIKDIALNTDIDWSFGVFKGLDIDKIYMALDYTDEISLESTLFEVGGDDKPLYKALLDKTFLDEPSIELGKAAIYICPGISVNLRFELTYESSGKLKVSVSTANTKGFELKGSNFRSIDKSTRSADIQLTGEAGIYGTFTLALSLDYVVDEIDLLSLKLKTGPALKGEARLHGEEDEDPLFCIDVSAVYKIELKLILLEKVMKAFGLEASVTLIDEEYTLINMLHYENFKLVPECTLDDKEEETTTEENTIAVGIFALETSYLSLDVGSSGKIAIKSLPSGYSASDLVWQSSNPSVISVDANGNVTASSAGNASIAVSTKDGKYTASCAVIAKANIVISESNYSNNAPVIVAA